jgi:hypothetical protein
MYTLVAGLVVFNQLNPLSAYQLALTACFRNWQAILLCMVFIAILSVVATLPFFLGWVGLGWLILFSILLITNFYIWKDIFCLKINPLE